MPPTNTTPLGQRVSEAREAKGLSLRAAAEQIGMNFTYLRDIEIGRKTPSPEYLAAIARVLELDPEELADLAVIDKMPELPRYLRAKYELPPEAVVQLDQHFRRLKKQYGGRKKKAGGTS